jgi:cytochrome c-type biogenesis protein CcmE
VKKKVLIGGIIVAAAALGFLLYSIFNTGTPYVVTLSQFTAKQNTYEGRTIRVEGYVAANTIDWTSPDYNLKFILQDENGGNRLTVFYKGEKQDPSKFIEGIRLMVEGQYKNGILIANALNYECPAEYQDK